MSILTNSSSGNLDSLAGVGNFLGVKFTGIVPAERGCGNDFVSFSGHSP